MIVRDSPDTVTATRQYERWLTQQTDVVRPDLRVKHRRMEENPFVFFRATFYRWVQLWATVLPDAARAPEVASVGDLHMENFGTWRDAEGRLVWGINDFDEAHAAPYTNDLVRLATSVLLASHVRELHVSASTACESVLDGYVATLERGGRPVVLAERRRWLRAIAIAQLRDPATFWRKLLGGKACGRRGFPADVVRRAMPDPRLPYVVHRRRAGVGSLGRPRFVIIASLGGGHIAREIKAVVPSAFAWATEGREPHLDVGRMLDRAVRVPDPFHRLTERWIIRRLAPDCTKLDINGLTQPRDQARLLRAMGAEVANLHCASPTRAVLADLRQRPRRWLYRAAAEMADVTEREWKVWLRR